MNKVNKQHSRRGFTLIELLTTTMVASIVLSLGLPSFSAVINRTILQKEISLIQQTIAIARSGAVDHAKSTVICPLNSTGQCTDKWENEITVFLDADGNGEPDNQSNIIHILARISPKVTRRQYNRKQAIVFRHDGSAFGSNGTISVCISDSRVLSDAIILSGTGRLRKAPDRNSDGIAENAAGLDVDCR